MCNIYFYIFFYFLLIPMYVFQIEVPQFISLLKKNWVAIKNVFLTIYYTYQ